jgi:hypothetical protein
MAVELREFREPALEPGSVLLRTLYTPSELNQALADAEAMRLPKALVKPH